MDDESSSAVQDAISFGFLGLVLALGLLGCVIYRVVTAAERRVLANVSQEEGCVNSVHP